MINSERGHVRRTLSTPVESLTDKAVARLRDMILYLELAPGSALSEPWLVERLGASRTPVREALKLLAADGLVILRRNRAAMVSPLDGVELAHLFEVETALESFAARLAAKRMSSAELARLAKLQVNMEERSARGDRVGYARLNRKIHSLIVAGAANPALSDAHARLIGRLQRARNLALTSVGRVEESIAEHRQILIALQERDSEAAERLFAAHVARTGELIAGLSAIVARSARRTDGKTAGRKTDATAAETEILETM